MSGKIADYISMLKQGNEYSPKVIARFERDAMDEFGAIQLPEGVDYDDDAPVTLVVSEPQAQETPEKIGCLVRRALEQITAKQLLTNEIVSHLQDMRFCRETFGLRYPFLKKFDGAKSEDIERYVDNYPRYWKGVRSFGGANFMVTNDWFEKQREPFRKWLESVGLKM